MTNSEGCEYDKLDDLPYSSPSESSERDEELEEMDFTEYDDNDEGAEEHHRQHTSTDELDRGIDLGPNEQGLPRWCSCGNCTITSSEIEAVCCNDRPEIIDLLSAQGHCVTNLDFFRLHLLTDESLTYNRLILASMIKSDGARQNYLAKEFTNRLKRNLAYRTFLVIVHNGCPLGRYNRVVIPRCVVAQIRQKYPEESESLYTGFLEVQNYVAQTASTTMA
jgi:hypothetical protein